MPFAVESCGTIGKADVAFVNELGAVPAASGRIPQGNFVRGPKQLLSVAMALQKVNTQMYCKSGLVMSLQQGLGYHPGRPIPVRCGYI